MLQTDLLQVLVLSCVLISYSVLTQFTCPYKFPNCTCNSIDNYSFFVNCSLEYTTERIYNRFSRDHWLIIYPRQTVHITCVKRNYSWDQFLYGKILVGIDPIKFINFYRCPPPSAQNFNLVKKRLGLKSNIQSIKYQKLQRNLLSSDLDFLTDLTNLSLNNNKLYYLDVKLIWGLSNLTDLDLSHSRLCALPIGFFNHSKKLKSIDLTYNYIEELKLGVLDGLESIHKINLNFNYIKRLHSDVFQNLRTLRILSLDYNYLMDLPVDIFMSLTELKELNLSFNSFRILSKGIFRHNINLNSLKISHNILIMRLSKGLLANLPFLATVELQHDNLISVPEDLVWNSTSLKRLNLASNKLYNLPNLLLKDAIYLEELDLSYNVLQIIPNGFFSKTMELKTLNLSFNRLNYINRAIWKSLQKLEILNMKNNELSFIHQDAFAENIKLKILNLANNHLTMHTDLRDNYGRLSPLLHNFNLEEINLANNNINEFFSDWRSYLKLRKLDLQMNNLSKLEFRDFQFIAGDVEINLEHNKLKTVNLNRLEHMAKEYKVVGKVKLLLNGNPFECDCDLYSLLRYVQRKMKPIAYAYIQLELNNSRCSNPEYLNGIKLQYFDIENIQCKNKTWVPDSHYSCGLNGLCDCWSNPTNALLEMNCSAKGFTFPPEYIDTYGANSVALNLRYNQLVKQPKMTKWGYEKVSFLLLEGNMIETVDGSLITSNLMYLELKNNRLTYLDSAFLDKIKNGNSLLGLILSNNPWRCNCNTTPLHNFVQTHAVKFPDLSKVTCINHTNALVELTYTDLCPDLHHLIIVGSVIGYVIILLLSIILIIIYFHYKLPIKIWLYSHNLYLCGKNEPQDDKNKLYDVFISYSHKDKEFVNSVLLAKLEAKPYAYSICIHERDWIAGEWIPAQIQRSIDVSKSMIVVLSLNFIKSYWSKIEFQTAHKQAVERNGYRIIIILLEDIKDNIDLIDPDLAQYLKMYMFIKWGDPRFWQKLTHTLPHLNKLTSEAIQR